MINILSLLSNTIIFKSKTIDEIELILSNTKYIIKNFHMNDMIYNSDYDTKYIGIILKGAIEIQKNFASGKVLNIFIKFKGDSFGEGAVFSNTDTYPCTIISKSETTIIFFDKENILQLLSNDTCILNNFLYSIAKKNYLLNLKTELLSYSSIQQKISFSLLYLMDEHKRDNIVSLPYTKKQWSEYLNVSRPSLFRELKVLCKKNVIDIHKNKIIILNEKHLIKLLQN